ncbi:MULTISPECIES: ATP-binding protein [Gordonibacter]|uniref:4Fe-4S ferredoxin-type domain-containing protein n=1 Tax=Gordonibacter faecis TaxID=3047475 RepID=A0ABT7DN03_9ACTN|nr:MULTISPECIES: 4Fe-4S dicluster domain-containing protein [unclassified Gordonibacter]MDJ1650906.1 hypothetical protein [Gordonibacter sp. KGMB12511]HIW77433.1 hypothetical protein [Candidatus Gordonibacter avicola]
METPYLIQVSGACRGCGACVDQCDRDNLTIVDGRAVPREGYVCVGCRDCVKWCPTRALSLAPARPPTSFIRAR